MFLVKTRKAKQPSVKLITSTTIVGREETARKIFNGKDSFINNKYGVFNQENDLLIPFDFSEGKPYPFTFDIENIEEEEDDDEASGRGSDLAIGVHRSRIRTRTRTRDEDRDRFDLNHTHSFVAPTHTRPNERNEITEFCTSVGCPIALVRIIFTDTIIRTFNVLTGDDVT